IQQIGIFSLKLPAACSIWSIRCVYCNQNTILICSALKDKLVIGNYYIFVIAVAQSVAGSADSNQFPDKIGQFIRTGSLETRTQSIIIIRSFLAFFTPFTAIIDAGDAGHSEE